MPIGKDRETDLYTIPSEIPSREFAECWIAAGSHLNTKLKEADRVWPHGPDFAWYKADLNPGFLEHLSFRLGNQAFFVRLQDADGKVEGPGTVGGLLRVAGGWKGIPCLLPMRRTSETWRPEFTGWGLIHPQTKHAIDAQGLVSSEAVEMTDWEIHDFAVATVCASLEKNGFKIISSARDPEVYPSIWFRTKDGTPSWVLVGGYRFPVDPRSQRPLLPSNWRKVGHLCANVAPKMSGGSSTPSKTRGYFAPISIGRTDEEGNPKPLLRGYRLSHNFRGLSYCYTQDFEPEHEDS
jgi:hypothetical protein